MTMPPFQALFTAISIGCLRQALFTARGGNTHPQARAMVIEVKILRSRNYKGRCRDCKQTFRNGQLCVYDARNTVSKRYYHIDCQWGRNAIWKVERGGLISLDDGIRDEDRAGVQAQITAAVRRVRAAACADREREIQRQLADKVERLREFPAGQKTINICRQGSIDFVKILSYSRLGKSLRVRTFAKQAVDTWVQTWPDYFGNEVKRTVTLYRAEWDKPTDAIYSVNSCRLGTTLVKGGNRPIQFDAIAIPEVEENHARSSSTPFVNIRSAAGRLWQSVEVTPELTASKLRCSVASAIQLLPTRGTVHLCHGTKLLKGPEKLSDFCLTDGPLEITATVQANQSWANATDGRPMPYGIEYCVCSEDLAFECVIDRDYV